METNPPQTPSSPEVNQMDTPMNSPIQDRVSSPARPKGPNVSPIVLGLVALFLAGLIIATETMDLRVDWSRLGPGAIVGIGVLFVVLGAIGLVRHHDDA